MDQQFSGKVIDYYFSVLSDWAYFGGDRLERLARRYGAKINHMPIRLAAVYAGTGGILLQKRSKQRQDYRVLELLRWRDLLGMPINISPKYYPTDDEPASCLIIAAKMKGLEVGLLANSILRAIWAENRDISDRETLTRIAAGIGFDGGELVAAADADAVRGAFERYTSEAQERGVFGSPFYLCDGEIFWGQDRLDFLERVLARTTSAHALLPR
ncbi:MAG: 2-hydroxychromene-2-carboxylate isomerase [Xanthobacteraceae bacterium]